MKSFISIACLALCVATASAQYQSSAYQQRKMAPTPAYGNGARQSSSYGSGGSGAGSYGSSAMTSQYDERQASAGSSYGAPASGGYGAQAPSSYQSAKPKYEEPYHPPMPFAWGYDINDGYGGAQYHKENGDEYGKRTGSYGYTDAYGIYRQVDYVADENGFRATVKTNEPGTANEAPADVDWHAYEPPSKYYAGNTDSYSGSNSGYGSGSSSSSGSSYGGSSSPYGGSSMSSYQAPAAQSSSYGKARPSSSSMYGQQQQQSYGRQQQQSSYSGNSGYPQQQQQAYASSSVRVPVYAKSSGAALMPRKSY